MGSVSQLLCRFKTSAQIAPTIRCLSLLRLSNYANIMAATYLGRSGDVFVLVYSGLARFSEPFINYFGPHLLVTGQRLLLHFCLCHYASDIRPAT